MSAGAPTARGHDADPSQAAIADERRFLRTTAGLLTFDDRGILQLSGPESASFLQGLVTGDLRGLESGRGLDTAFLSPAGKVLSRVAVFREGPETLLLLLQGPAQPLIELLDRYHFGERVEVADLSTETDWFSVYGPAAPAAIDAALGDDAASEPGALRTVSFGEAEARIARVDELGAPGVHVLFRHTPALTPELRGQLEEAVRQRGGGLVSRAAWETVRVQAGVPWMGAELDESVLPMEAGLHHLLDASKGCYVGQEVVARAQVQGRTNWSLWGVRLPADATAVVAGGELMGIERPRAVVRVRTVARDPESGERIALAFVHREAARPGVLRVRDAEAGELEVSLEPLPFATGANAIGAPTTESVA